MKDFVEAPAPNGRARPALWAAMPLVVAVFALSGCDSGQDFPPDSKSEAAGGASVIAPGRPGDVAETLSVEDAAKLRPGDDSPNAADFSYARMMVEHHAQALEMAGLVPTRAASGRVKRLAERIAAAQGPEIAAMEAWLESHSGERKSTAHDHGDMPGMVSTAQLKKLRAAKGAAFDTSFLTLMITHHDGAITMATEVKAQGNNIQIEEMADDVIAQQTAEISRMRDMS